MSSSVSVTSTKPPAIPKLFSNIEKDGNEGGMNIDDNSDGGDGGQGNDGELQESADKEVREIQRRLE